jgi:putative PIN family toxin of toxin-antitoxin system
MRITLDTNVLVSATFWKGDSFRIMALVEEKKLTLVLSLPIIEEYFKVINSDEIIDKMKNKEIMISEIIENVMNSCEVVEPKIKLDVVEEDTDDNKVLECAKQGKVDCIITQDQHLLKLRSFDEISILTPAAFLEMISAGQS